MLESERLAIRQSFAEALAGTKVMVDGLITTHVQNLTKSGADIVYVALTKRDWTITRGVGEGTPVPDREVVNELTGWIVVIDGVGWDPTEQLAREGAEAIVDKYSSAGWVVSRK